jgi:hypothetical protein
MCNIAVQPGVVILLTKVRGITMTGCGALSHTSFLLASTTRASEASTPTRGGDAFGTTLAKNHRFDSSGLNITFEGLLLGVSLRLYVSGTSSDPR